MNKVAEAIVRNVKSWNSDQAIDGLLRAPNRNRTVPDGDPMEKELPEDPGFTGPEIVTGTGSGPELRGTASST